MEEQLADCSLLDKNKFSVEYMYDMFTPQELTQLFSVLLLSCPCSYRDLMELLLLHVSAGSNPHSLPDTDGREEKH